MMISERKRAANCANARSSTGPRTAAGKTRAAKNALRHGLRSPVLSDPVLMAEVESLAKEIAGEEANEVLRELAGRIAEAQINLVRVRRARQDFIAQALADSHEGSTRFSHHAERFGDKAPLSEGGEEQKLARIFNQEAARFALFERYDRRARSRRKFAIRAFDSARQQSA